MLLLLFSCQQDSTKPAPQEQEDTVVWTAEEEDSAVAEERVYLRPAGELPIEVETLQTAIQQASHSQFRRLTQHDNGWSLWDPAKGLSTEITTEGEFLHLGVAPAGEILVFTAQEVWFWDDEVGLERSPLADLLPPDLVRVQMDRWGFWLQHEQGLYRYRDGFLHSLEIDNEPITGVFQAGGLWDSTSVLWVAADQLYAIAENDAVYSPVAAVPLQHINGLSVDRQNRIWVQQEDGTIQLRDGNWKEQLFEVSPKLFMGNPDADTTWFQWEAENWVYTQGEFWRVSVPPGEWLDVDGAGRLLLLQDDNLMRVGIDRPIGMVNVPKTPLTESRELIFDPAFYSEVSQIIVRLHQTEITLEGPPWSLELQPAALGQGAVEMHTHVLYTDGSSAEQEIVFDVDLGLTTWEDDIAPLNQTKCANCHSGGTRTILDTKTQWEQTIEEVITMVELGAMPQGGPPLSADEVGKIIQWRDLGFP